MFIVSKSRVMCDKCEKYYEVEWDLELISSEEKEMGYNNLYNSEVEAVCPYCGDEMNLKLSVGEYPEGTLEFVQVRGDESHPKPNVENPDVRFYDL